MSIGPGKIRVFRADDKGVKKSKNLPHRKSKSPKARLAPKPESRVCRDEGKRSERHVAANNLTVSPANSNRHQKPISKKPGKSALP